METSQDILVIILSATLAILLVLCIMISVLTIQVLQAVKRISTKAEGIVNTAEHVGQAFSNTAGSMAVVRLVRNIVELATKKHGGK
jgi:phage-related minor tail protein